MLSKCKRVTECDDGVRKTLSLLFSPRPSAVETATQSVSTRGGVSTNVPRATNIHDLKLPSIGRVPPPLPRHPPHHPPHHPPAEQCLVSAGTDVTKLPSLCVRTPAFLDKTETADTDQDENAHEICGFINMTTDATLRMSDPSGRRYAREGRANSNTPGVSEYETILNILHSLTEEVHAIRNVITGGIFCDPTCSTSGPRSSVSHADDDVTLNVDGLEASFRDTIMRPPTTSSLRRRRQKSAHKKPVLNQHPEQKSVVWKLEQDMKSGVLR